MSKLIKKELQNYIKNKKSFKPYMDSMKEINSWLKGIK